MTALLRGGESVDQRMLFLQSILLRTNTITNEAIDNFSESLLEKGGKKGRELQDIFMDMDRDRQALMVAFDNVDSLQLSTLIEFIGQKMAANKNGFNLVIEGRTLEEIANALQNFFLLTGKNIDRPKLL